MMLRRSKSSRPPPKPPAARQQVQAIAVFARIDDALMLEAVLSGVAEHDVVAQGKRSNPRHVVEDAFAVCAKAWEFVRRVDPVKKNALRGCSRELLILAARQAILLDDLLRRVETDAKEQADAQQRGRQQLQSAFERAGKLRDQARRLFGKIAGMDASARAEVQDAALAEEQGGAVVEALEQLAQFGRRLLSDQDPARQQCIALYGLDQEYVQILEKARDELRRSEAEFESASETEGPGDQVQWCAGVNLLLMTQIIEAFLGANELDSNIPCLRTAHHEQLVRRISRLPPPPLPRALAPRIMPPPKARIAQESGGATRQYAVPAATGRIQVQEVGGVTGAIGPGMAFKGRLGGR